MRHALSGWTVPANAMRFPSGAGAGSAQSHSTRSRSTGRALVEERLVACGNLLPGARSIFRWQGAISDEREVVVLMKTRKQDWAALLSRLHELHPYDTPECVAVRMAAVAPKYMAWLEAA